MLEHVWPEELHRAARNIIVPNPEFFDRHDCAWLASLDQVWAKTEHALRIFAARSACPVIKTGCDGRDRNDASIPRERHFLHLAGKSRMKGTSRLIDVWTRHPEWPSLTVVVSPGRRIPLIRAANLHYIEAFLGDAELSELQNRHQFHVCVSEAEGWGHSLVEAQSAGAIVLATDAPPMNEHVSADSGLLVLAHACARQHLALRHAFDEQDFGRAVTEALAMDAEQLRRRGTAARERFMSHRESFAAGVSRALQALRL
jgi:glycosyltransferase involved in cell wall biosynthesis